MSFGNRLREFRIKADYSLKDLAIAVSSSASTLSKYENGEMEPKIDMLLLICSTLNCTPNQILGIENQPQLSPITVECASMIEDMSLPQKQWIFLTIDGIKTGIRNLENSTRLRTDFLKSSGHLSKTKAA